jgi:hypothetical protein
MALNQALSKGDMVDIPSARKDLPQCRAHNSEGIIPVFSLLSLPYSFLDKITRGYTAPPSFTGPASTPVNSAFLPSATL